MGLGTAWSRDGRHVLFMKIGNVQQGTNGHPQLCSIPVEGGASQAVGLSMNNVWGFSLNPRNTRLAFVGGEPRLDLWGKHHINPSGQSAERGA
jgi:Tol biopolymer transport system component